MSASLDDMEPYEIFQQELDSFAKEYEKWLLKTESKNKALSKLTIIHSFIEYVCFHKTIDNFNDISYELIVAEFPEFRTVDQNELNHLVKGIREFLQFVKKQYGIENEDLMNKLNQF